MAKGDHIRLYEDIDRRIEVLPLQTWEGAWPPPERIGLLVGKQSGRPHSLITSPEGESDVREHLAKQGYELEKWFRLRWFVRDRYSQISDEDIAEMTHVARSAAYLPEELAE